MKRILITAQNSFIGTSLRDYLEKAGGFKVDCISQRDESWKNTDFSVYDSIVDVTGKAHADTKDPSEELKREYEKINCDLAYETAKKAKNEGVPHFIYLSSMIVFGESSKAGRGKPIKRDGALNPAGAYGLSKMHAEERLSELSDELFKVAVIRPPMVYGRNCKGNYNKLSKFAKLSLFVPEVDNLRSMIYIDHLCELIRLIIINEDGGFFMPSDAEPVNTSDMVVMISKLHGLPCFKLKGFVGILNILSGKVPVLKKVFGSFVYEDGGDYYGGTYRMYDFEECLKFTEGIMDKKREYLEKKRYMDCLLSLLALLILWPVLLGISIAILIDDPGPVLFKQKRVGYGKKNFEIYKFRTMRTDTPKDVPTHMLKDPDSYITKVGAFLRKTSLDELPQLFNIIKGEMSFVGPRPALWNQFDLIKERDKYGANYVPVGLTGWAQVNGRDELTIEQKARLDGEYASHFGLFMDIKCLLKTVIAVIISKGVKEGGTGGR